MIIDAFIYSDEIELLELRFKYLKEKIDCFVLICGSHFFTGGNKENTYKNEIELAHTIGVPLIIKEVEFKKSLIFRIYKRFYKRRLHYFSETYQRKMGLEFIKANFSKNDILIFSDIDEFPSKNFLDNNIESIGDEETRVLMYLSNYAYYYVD